jgi:hypothetical protein
MLILQQAFFLSRNLRYFYASFLLVQQPALLLCKFLSWSATCVISPASFLLVQKPALLCPATFSLFQKPASLVAHAFFLSRNLRYLSYKIFSCPASFFLIQQPAIYLSFKFFSCPENCVTCLACFLLVQQPALFEICPKSRSHLSNNL